MNESKKIEPTDAMVEVALFQRPLTPVTIRAILRDALNHTDAPGLFAADEDARPWEPLDGGRVYVGDEVRQDYYGITHTAVVDRVDEDGDPWSTEDGFIGQLELGTWHVRRAALELPEEDCSQIIPALGAIEAVRNGVTYTAGRAVYDDMEDVWVGVWRCEDAHSTYEMRPEYITPGTWKVDDELSVAPPECECPGAPEHLWTTYGGAVDPNTLFEHNPECPVHRIDPQDSRLPDAWTRALNNPGTW